MIDPTMSTKVPGGYFQDSPHLLGDGIRAAGSAVGSWITTKECLILTGQEARWDAVRKKVGRSQNGGEHCENGPSPYDQAPAQTLRKPP